MLTPDYSKDSLLTPFAIETLKESYLTENEKSPQDAFVRASLAFADDEEHAKRLYSYVSNLWFMFASPILSNGGTERGLPISCFLSHVDDSIEGIAEHYGENSFLSTKGGGIGGYWGGVRSVGTKTSTGNETTGVLPFIHVVDAQMLAFRQGKSRRGSYAAYIDVSHPEIEDFVIMRKPSGGDIYRKNLNLHHGVNIPDAFMDAVKDDKDWNLIDPYTKKVVRTVRARDLWIKILETRMSTGEPYLHFIDTTNRNMPKALRDRGLMVSTSNLCSEIVLPTSKDRTAICCLSSVNIEKFEEWSEVPEFIPDIMRMLDNVISKFILDAPSQMWRAVNSADRERSVGLGAMGFHSFLQSKMIPFDSVMARVWNKKIFSHIREKADEASLVLGKERGEPADMQGTGERFAHKMAVAPNASSSIICGTTSPSIEPFRANAYKQKTISGSFFVKNKHLRNALDTVGLDTPEMWSEIITNDGSIQHIEEVPEYIKEVFKTAMELEQEWVVLHAADRQPFIDQAQSVNLFFPSGTSKQDFVNAHMMAYERGLKTLYYCRSTSAGKTESLKKTIDNSQKVSNNEEQEYETCLFCEG